MSTQALQRQLAATLFAQAKGITVQAVRAGSAPGRRATAYRAARLLRDALRYLEAASS